MERCCTGLSRYHGTKGSQASHELGEGDIMRLRVTRLLSPIRSGSPGGEIGEHIQNHFYLNQGTRTGDWRISYYGHDSLFSRTDQIGEIGHCCVRQSECQGTMGVVHILALWPLH